MAIKTSPQQSAAQEWRERMSAARADLPEGIGQQPVLEWVVKQCPEIDTLLNISRWRNAWHSRVADPELTKLVEAAAVHFNARDKEQRNRLSRQKIKKVK